MAHRRAPGEGSIYAVKKDGKTVAYAATIEAGYADGRRRRKKVQRRTRREVAEAVAQLKAQQAGGVDLTSKQPTVRAFCTAWLDTFALRARPKSVETYRQMFVYSIFPVFGDQKLSKVTHRQAQALVTSMNADGRADKTIGLVRAAGRQAWQAAIKEGLTDRNPWQGLTLPTGNARKAIALTVPQAKALLQAARGDRLEVALRLMLSLGLRRGEVCALRWDTDVDLEKGILTVRGTLGYIQGHGLTRGDPKTDAGERSFKLPPALLAALVWHRQQQERERALMGSRWVNSGYVFVSSTTGGALNSNCIYDCFKRAAKAAGLPKEATPHTLRHSCASFLHAEGASLKKISVYLGHANTTITNNVYVHLFQDELDDGAATVDDLLSQTA